MSLLDDPIHVVVGCSLSLGGAGDHSGLDRRWAQVAMNLCSGANQAMGDAGGVLGIAVHHHSATGTKPAWRIAGRLSGMMPR